MCRAPIYDYNSATTIEVMKPIIRQIISIKKGLCRKIIFNL